MLYHNISFLDKCFSSVMPSKATLFNLKCEPIFDFGTGHRNVANFNPQGNNIPSYMFYEIALSMCECTCISLVPRLTQLFNVHKKKRGSLASQVMWKQWAWAVKTTKFKWTLDNVQLAWFSLVWCCFLSNSHKLDEPICDHASCDTHLG